MSKICECRICTHGRLVRDLIHRTGDEADRKLIEELYSLYFHAEDDRDYYAILTAAYRKKHGTMSFAEACAATAGEQVS